MSYAADTTVPVSRTKQQIDDLLRDHKAAQRLVFEDDVARVAMVQFALRERVIRFRVSIPSDTLLRAEYQALSYTQRSRMRKGRDAWVDQEVAQRHRQRWRALLLVLKAKLESLESGIETFEQAFLAHIVTDSGETVGDRLLPVLDRVVSQGPARLLLAGGSSETAS